MKQGKLEFKKTQKREFERVVNFSDFQGQPSVFCPLPEIRPLDCSEIW